MNDYVSREDVLRKFIEGDGHDDERFTEGYNFAVQEYREEIKNIKAADVQPVVDTENMATVSDEFICKKCGIYLKDYIKVVLDEDNDGYVDEQHYDYEPKFCPECGAKVKDGDENDN